MAFNHNKAQEEGGGRQACEYEGRGWDRRTKSSPHIPKRLTRRSAGSMKSPSFLPRYPRGEGTSLCTRRGADPTKTAAGQKLRIKVRAVGVNVSYG